MWHNPNQESMNVVPSLVIAVCYLERMYELESFLLGPYCIEELNVYCQASNIITPE